MMSRGQKEESALGDCCHLRRVVGATLNRLS